MHEFTIGRALASTFRIWARNLPKFLLLAAVVYVPYAAFLAGVLGGVVQLSVFSAGLATILLASFLHYVTSSTVVYGVVSELRGQPVGLGRCLAVGLSRLFPVLGVSVVSGLVVGLGTVALVVPGMIFACMLYVVVPVAVVERLGLGGSLSRSRALTADHRLGIFGLLVLVGLASWGVTLVLEVTLPPLEHGVAWATAHFLQTVVFASLGSVMQAVVYHDLRNAKEGAVADDLARVFD